MKIGFIGQGWIGKNYADDFEKRGFPVVRYALEEPYVQNKEQIAECDIVFVAVPTPTTPDGFDYSMVQDVMSLIGKGKTAVIKSTILPGTTKAIQKEYQDLFIFHSPEFLAESTAAYDATNPTRNIIGTPIDTEEYHEKADIILSVLPKAPFELICGSGEAELVKYAGNVFLYMKVVYANMLYDLAENLGVKYDTVRNVVAADPRIGTSHFRVIHQSNPFTQSGRGAGGHCFIKDSAAFSEMYRKEVGDALGIAVLESIKMKNIDLLYSSGKDTELLKGVYGDVK